MSLRQCRAEVDEAELDEWAAYATLEPFGEERADARAALIAFTVARSQHSGKGRKPRFEDFLLSFGGDEPARREQTPDEMAAVMKSFAKGHNRSLKRKGAGRGDRR